MIPGFSPDHPSWQVLKQEIEQRIERLRTSLEGVDLDHPATQLIRGQIMGLRALIADIDEVPSAPVSTPGYE
jgi:hypothetical protein